MIEYKKLGTMVLQMFDSSVIHGPAQPLKIEIKTDLLLFARRHVHVCKLWLFQKRTQDYTVNSSIFFRVLILIIDKLFTNS